MRSVYLKIFFILGCALVAFAINYWLNPAVDAFKNTVDKQRISLEAAQVYGERILWVDARSADAYNAGHIPTALNVTMAAFDDQFGELLDLWTPQSVIIVYCDSEGCNASAEVAAKLAEYIGDEMQAEIFILNGGWQAWQQANSVQ